MIVQRMITKEYGGGPRFPTNITDAHGIITEVLPLPEKKIKPTDLDFLVLRERDY